MMSDLRESGSLEQDADVVILLNREDAYEKESPRAGEADFIVAKHRNGPTATITVAFQGHYSRFVDMATSSEAPLPFCLLSERRIRDRPWIVHAAGCWSNPRVRMHHDEIAITEAQVAELIAEQAPRWRGLAVRRLNAAGTVNAIFRVGGHSHGAIPAAQRGASARRRRLHREASAMTEFLDASAFPAPSRCW